MKIAIIGTGGVGGFYGAKMAKAGNEVIFLARGAYLEALNKNGTVVKLAEQFGIDVPINRFIYHCILPMEKKVRQKGF